MGSYPDIWWDSFVVFPERPGAATPACNLRPVKVPATGE
jgi:hypothetical protein